MFTNINSTVKEIIENLHQLKNYASTESKINNLIDENELKSDEVLPFITENEINSRNMQKDTNLNIRVIENNMSIESLHKIKITKP